jgi:amino acid transporter
MHTSKSFGSRFWAFLVGWLVGFSGIIFSPACYLLAKRIRSNSGNAKKLRETESGIKNLEETLGERNLPYFRQR